MKLFTRLLAATGLLLLQVPAWAATVVVQVRDFEYSPQVVNIAPGDVVRFQWVSGTHPTVSDSSPAAFAAFTPSASVPTRDVTFNTAGTYDYHCTAHGAAGRVGMWGSVSVSPANPTREATKQAAALLNVYPNPVRGGEATLTMSDLKPGQAYRLRITNIIGREVQNVALRPDIVTNGQPISFSALPAGLYICSVLSNDKVLATKRVTVQD
ncbi:T9SS type A sorting domain-containing protein [Hymenobacter sp. 15J16-1T3B]|uniref:T9SS type A sorting domain-containing protein n=1 Tax=Hymenobacter sp. 15J16-1T3B TaxID=2886941 RepID=UPI001D10BD16|nr:T9SS type A sorting domain-containing protein [Hymenobacter sp. 15J16-1T3B]MCC3159202.1 T9SS type A sorting domain-containing protein [Hymenobacter sp. 15J16-1T3B]